MPQGSACAESRKDQDRDVSPHCHACSSCLRRDMWEQIRSAFSRPSWKHIGKKVPKQRLGCERFSHTLSGKQQWPTVSLTDRAHSLPQSTDSTVTFHFLTGHEDEVDSHFIATSVTFLYTFPDNSTECVTPYNCFYILLDLRIVSTVLLLNHFYFQG